MARMIPENKPNITNSPRAEPNIYWQLKKQLSDEFIVIHSLPWLAAGVVGFNGRKAPTGEIDFLVLHAELGILAVEIKGGRWKYDRTKFVLLRTKEISYPIQQARSDSFVVSKWLNNTVNIGYALLFPDCEMNNRQLPPALIDRTLSTHQSIVLDHRDVNNLGIRIIEVMQYWKDALRNKALGKNKIDQIINLICPIQDYTPCWQTRINDDTMTWLQLTDEQSDCFNRLIKEQRIVVEGYPGTGKTLLALSLARQLSENNQKVLLLAYNVLLVDYLRRELRDTTVSVLTFYELCRRAATLLKKPVDSSEEWYKSSAFPLLVKAITEGKLQIYDALIIDEAQVFHSDWIITLNQWFTNKKIVAFGDETQVFEFEKDTISTKKLATLIGALEPFVLTISIRSPKTIFERLQQIRPANYQQYSPRQSEPDTLVELVEYSPNGATVDKLLHQLHKEGIPREAIVFLHSSDIKFYIPEDLVAKTSSIAKFRGMESPVVIIWTKGGIGDIDLFCAYSRATSRCIVIYDLIEIAKARKGEFGKVLLDNSNQHHIQQRVDSLWTSVIVPNMKLELTEVVSKTASVSWCNNWASWFIVVKHPNDLLASTLWRDHILLTSDAPLYWWYSENPYLLNYFNPVSKLIDRASSEKFFMLTWCSNCERLTKFKFPDSSTSSMKCADCEEVIESKPVSMISSVYSNFDEVLATPEKYSSELKRQMGISLIALGRFRSLTKEKQTLIAQNIGSEYDRIVYHAGQILSGIDVINSKVGTKITLDNIREQYPRWCSELNSLAEWHNVASHCCNKWLQCGWLKKLSQGVYERESIINIDYT